MSAVGERRLGGGRLGEGPLGERITTDGVAEAVARGLGRHYRGARHAVERCALRVGADARAAKNWFSGDKAPKAEHLVRLLAEFDEVAEEVLQLARRGRLAETERLRGRLETALRLIEAEGL